MDFRDYYAIKLNDSGPFWWFKTHDNHGYRYNRRFSELQSIPTVKISPISKYTEQKYNIRRGIDYQLLLSCKKEYSSFVLDKFKKFKNETEINGFIDCKITLLMDI